MANYRISLKTLGLRVPVRNCSTALDTYKHLVKLNAGKYADLVEIAWDTDEEEEELLKVMDFFHLLEFQYKN
jgi:hypothetical protein